MLLRHHLFPNIPVLPSPQITFGTLQATVKNADPKIKAVLEMYQPLLIPSLTSQQLKLLKSISKAYEQDAEKAYQLEQKLIQRKDFPWDKVPGVQSITLDNRPDESEMFHYRFYPKSTDRGEWLFIDRNLFDWKGIDAFQYRLLRTVYPEQITNENNIELYYGNDFDETDPAMEPLPYKPIVFKMSMGNVWYTVSDEKLFKAGVNFLGQLHLLLGLRSEYQEFYTQAQKRANLKRHSSFYTILKQPIAATPKRKRRTWH